VLEQLARPALVVGARGCKAAELLQATGETVA
jgi:hypothetical protein